MWSIPANVPIMFEMTVLFSGITTLVGMLILNGMPHPSHPLDQSKSASLAPTDDRFFLHDRGQRSEVRREQTRALLEGTGAVVLDEVREDTRHLRSAAQGRHLRDDHPDHGRDGAAGARGQGSTLEVARPAYPPDRRHGLAAKYKAQRQNPVFSDTRAQREPVAGTIASAIRARTTTAFRGKVDGQFARTFPFQLPLTQQTVERGQQRFGIYCTPCHGLLGDGHGMVTRRAEALIESGRGRGMAWVPPTDMNQAHIQAQPVGQLFDDHQRYSQHALLRLADPHRGPLGDRDVRARVAEEERSGGACPAPAPAPRASDANPGSRGAMRPERRARAIEKGLLRS